MVRPRGARRQRAGVRRGVDAAGHAGDHHKSGARQFGGEILGDAAAVGRGVAPADQRDGAGGEQRRVAQHGDHRRGIVEPGEQRRIVGVAQQQQPGTERRGAFQLAQRVGLGRHHRVGWPDRRPWASRGSALSAAAALPKRASRRR